MNATPDAAATADAATEGSPRDGTPTARPRVAFYIDALAVGGAQRVTVTIANGLAARGYPVDLVVSFREGPLLDDVDPAVRLVDLGTPAIPGLGTLASVPGLRRYLRRERPAVLFAAMLHGNVVATLARTLAGDGTGTRLALTEHNTFGARSELRNRIAVALASRLYPLADRVVGVSAGVVESVRDGTRVDPDRVAVLYNPIDVEAIRAAAAVPLDEGVDWLDDPARDAVATAHLGLGTGETVDGESTVPSDVAREDLCRNPSTGGPLLFTVGRLEDAKDVPTMLRAFVRVRARHPDARLVVAGEGSGRARLAALARELGIDHAVRFPGYVDNAYGCMARADAFVLSSVHEGLPTVLLEALAVGTPIVSTDCPSGPREILEDGTYGPLVPVGDAGALADAILETLEAPPGSDDLRRRAAAFSVGAVMARYDEFVGELVEDG